MVAAAEAAAFAAAAADAAAAAEWRPPDAAEWRPAAAAEWRPADAAEWRPPPPRAEWSQPLAQPPPPPPPPPRLPPHQPALPPPASASATAGRGRIEIDPSPRWSSRHQGEGPRSPVEGPRSQVAGVLAYLIVNARRAIVQRSSHSRCSIVAESEQSFRRKRVIIELANCLKWLQAAPEQLRSSLK